LIGLIRPLGIQSRAARSTYDELASEQYISRGRVGIRDAIQHDGQRRSTYVLAGLMEGCEWNWQKARIFHVVYSYNPDVPWYFFAD